MKKENAQFLIERVANLLRAETRSALYAMGLQPVQFEALHYLSMCNRYSDTPMAVTEYLGQTKGTVSQTLKVLEKNGLIVKHVDAKDKRVTHLKVTAAGRHLIEQLVPSPLFTQGEQLLNATQQKNIGNVLAQLLKGMQQANDFKTFGQCATCKHNIRLSPVQAQCGLTGERLSTTDIELICREHADNVR